MFRRKEEGLFDSDVIDETETNESAETVNVLIPTAAPVAANPYSASGQSAARPAVPSAAPAPAAATTSFRPASATTTTTTNAAAQANMDANRPRVPEAKPVVPVASTSAAQQLASKNGNRVLTVGNDILLKGEINTCDRLVIQGKVEATLNDVHTVELADTGSFKGTANVVEAHISGNFEGDLVCTGRLIIHASGKVHGKITYGEIEIERGGELTGEIKTVSSAQAAPKAIRKEAA